MIVGKQVLYYYCSGGVSDLRGRFHIGVDYIGFLLAVAII